MSEYLDVLRYKWDDLACSLDSHKSKIKDIGSKLAVVERDLRATVHMKKNKKSVTFYRYCGSSHDILIYNVRYSAGKYFVKKNGKNIGSFDKMLNELRLQIALGVI